MKAYIAGNYTINDNAMYMEYMKKVGGIVSKYNGRTLIADHDFSVLEGKPGKVMVLVEFDSFQEAQNFYNSIEYQEIVNFRKQSTEGWLLIASEFKMMGN